LIVDRLKLGDWISGSSFYWVKEMTLGVAIIGIGMTQLRSITPDLSYKEMMFEAAVKAYGDAGVDPRRDVQSFVCSSEDFWEGTSIFHEYVPDQIGGSLKPVCTISGDGLYSLITAYMQISSGLIDVAAVEAHSKASEIVSIRSIMSLALDPIYARPLAVDPYFVGGLEMARYLHESGNTREQCARVVEKNRRNALKNPYAAYPSQLTAQEVLTSEPVCYPLGKMDIAEPADGAAVVVLASEKRAKEFCDDPVWILGLGWCSDTPCLEAREWGEAAYAKIAADKAFGMTGKVRPKDIDLLEIDDSLSYKELQHLEAMGFCRKGEAGLLTEKGATKPNGELPVNASGGSLGMGYTFEMAGLQRLCEVVLQLRNEAGEHQVKNVHTGFVQCWRGIPTASGAAIILSSERS